MKTKNLDIQLMKFVYSCVIVIYHLTASTRINCIGGYCGVEYFLLTAGLFLFLSFERGEAAGRLITPGQYVLRRFSRFFPWAFTGFLFAGVIDYTVIGKTESLGRWMDHFAKDLWDMLLISWNGMNKNTLMLNAPAWTLSAMLIVGFFIWTLLYHYKRPFLSLIMPLTLVVGFGIWTHLPSADTERWIGFTNFGTFRTWLIMCLSYYCVLLGRKLSEVPLNRKGKLLLTAVEVLIHVFALVVMFRRAERYYQWMLTLLFMLSIGIAISGHSYLADVLERSRLSRYLGEISMSVYLVHAPLIRLFRHFYDVSDWSYPELMPLFAAVLAASVVHHWITGQLVRASGKLFSGMKRLLTE